MMVKHSGLQKRVIALYKQALTAARRKDASTGGAGRLAQSTNVATVREQFRGKMDVDRNDFRSIEFLLRQGERQIKMLETESVTKVQVVHIPRS